MHIWACCWPSTQVKPSRSTLLWLPSATGGQPLCHNDCQRRSEALAGAVNKIKVTIVTGAMGRGWRDGGGMGVGGWRGEEEEESVCDTQTNDLQLACVQVRGGGQRGQKDWEHHQSIYLLCGGPRITTKTHRPNKRTHTVHSIQNTDQQVINFPREFSMTYFV